MAVGYPSSDSSMNDIPANIWQFVFVRTDVSRKVLLRLIPTRLAGPSLPRTCGQTRSLAL